MAKRLPIERAYSYAQAIMSVIPRAQWLAVAKTLAGEPSDWSEGYEQVLRRVLAERIMEGPSSVRLTAEIISHESWKIELERAMRSVVHRIEAWQRNPEPS